MPLALRRCCSPRESLTLPRRSRVGLEIEKLKLLLAKLRQRASDNPLNAAGCWSSSSCNRRTGRGTQAETGAEMRGKARSTGSDESRKPARRPLPDNLPVSVSSIPRPVPVPTAAGGCASSARTSPRPWSTCRGSWKVIQHVREKFSCRACEAIAQAPAPSHPIPRGLAGPNLLAHVLVGKYRLHLPLNRQRKPMPAKALSSMSRRWRTGSARRRQAMPLIEGDPHPCHCRRAHPR